MNIIKRKLVTLLLWLLDGQANVDYKRIDKRQIEDWAFYTFSSPGWRSYFAFEDLKILKQLGQFQDREAHLLLTGKRLMLLSIMAEANKAQENRKKREEKQAIKAKQYDARNDAIY